ncbi:hypothetical protein EZS27_008667 [termite gut metagenome]|uniref:Minor tail protein gp31 C-terminal domain-containing protein n=1 Tax=termite gut metagenome TaxID=433724 RepID=A0A5J4SD36_9ZZZZ
MTIISIVKDYILIKNEAKTWGFKSGTLRHEVEGSAVSFYYLDNNEFERPVLTSNIADILVNEVQATVINIDNLLEEMYNASTSDTFVESFTLDEATDLLQIKQNDGSFFNVYLSKYDTDLQINIIVEKLNEEISRAELAEENIQISLNTFIQETANKFIADEALINENKQAIETETISRIEKEGELQNQISINKEDIANLNEKIDGEYEDVDEIYEDITDIKETLGNLNEKIDGEITNRENADTILQNNLDNISSNLTVEEERAVTRENYLDTRIDNISEKENDTQTNIAVEISNRENADTILQNNLDNEVSRATTAENTIVQNVTDKIQIISAVAEQAAQVAVTQFNILSDKVDGEIQRSIQKDWELNTNIQTEIQRAKDNEDLVNADLINEVSRSTTAEQVLDNKIQTEKTDRLTVENGLQTAVGTLQTSLSNEITDRTVGLNALSNTVNTLSDKVDIVSETLTEDHLTLTTKINTEKDRAILTEQVLSNSLQSEILRSSTQEQIISNNVTNLEVKHDLDIELFDLKLNTEKDRAIGVETIIQNNLSLFETECDAKDTVLEANLNAEISRATNAETVNANAISSESIRATSIENNLDIKINAEISRAELAENTLANEISIHNTQVSNDLLKYGNLVVGTNVSSYELIESRLNELGFGYKNIIELASTLKSFLSSSKIDDVVTKFEQLEEFLEQLIDAGSLTELLQAQKDEILGGASTEYDTLEKLYQNLVERIAEADIDLSGYYTKLETDSLLLLKVDKSEGKDLSDENFTLTEKQKLASLQNYDDSTLTSAIGLKANTADVYTQTIINEKLDDLEESLTELVSTETQRSGLAEQNLGGLISDEIARAQNKETELDQAIQAIEIGTSTEVLEAIQAEKTRAEGVESGLTSSINTINTYKVNNKYVSGSPVLYGSDVVLSGYTKAGSSVPVSDTDTTNVAIGKLEYKVDNNKEITDAYTVNSKTISTNPVLGGGDIALTNYVIASSKTNVSTSDKINEAIGKLEYRENVIDGYKVNNKTVSGNPVLNGADIKLDSYVKADSASAITTADTVNAGLGKLEYKVDSNKGITDAYTVNSKIISTNPVLAGDDIVLSGYTKATSANAVLPTDTTNQAIGKLEYKVDTNKTTSDTYTVNSKTISDNPVLNGGDIALTNYVKASSQSAITPTDTVNISIGKVEKKADDVISSVSTINTYTVNSKAISGSPILNGSDITLSGYTVASAKTAITTTDTVNVGLGKLEKRENLIDAYTINTKTVSGNPVLNGADITLSGYTKATGSTAIGIADTVNVAIGKVEYKTDAYKPVSGTNISVSTASSGSTINYTGFNNWVGTQGEYDAISVKDTNTIYLIKE